jgi:hypothetical protein
MESIDGRQMKDYIGFRGDTMNVDLWYPRNSKIKQMQIGLIDVRAADDIRIHYDFARDGWVVEQNSDKLIEETDEWDWQEVAFIKAWQLYDREAENEATKND